MSRAPANRQAFILPFTWQRIHDLQILRLDTVPEIDAELVQRLPQFQAFPVHFFVISIIARYSSLNKASFVGKTVLVFVTLRSWRL